MLQQLDTLIGFAVVMSVVSLLITIITQMISSLLGLRGYNLADALEAMLQKIVPDLDGKIRKQLVDHVLTRPMLSDSMLSMSENSWDKIPVLAWFRKRWKRASAIRPEEVLEALKDVAKVAPDQAKAQLDALQKAAAQPPPIRVAALEILSALHVPTSDTNATVETLTAQLPGLTQAAQVQANALIAQLNDAASIADANLEKWFSTAQDRAQQWFAMHARFWTVIASILLAFLLQLDTFRLITKLSSDPNERGKLIQFSQTTLQKKADEVFTHTLSSAAIYQEAIERLKTSTNISGVANIGAAPANLSFETQSSAESWLKDQSGTNHLNTVEVLTAFRNAVQTVTRENYNRAGGEFASLTDAFGQTGVQLMPQPYPPVFTEEWKLWSWPWEWHWSGVWSWPASHLFGILTSAALLSLGAPFWFNSLKSLANLRPLLADQIGQEEKSKSTTQAG